MKKKWKKPGLCGLHINQALCVKLAGFLFRYADSDTPSAAVHRIIF